MSQACHKKYLNDSKAEFTGCLTETESDSDIAEGTEGEDGVSASYVIYSSKNSQQCHNELDTRHSYHQFWILVKFLSRCKSDVAHFLCPLANLSTYLF